MRFLKDYDLKLVGALFGVQLIGLLGVYSASFKGSHPPSLFVKQLLYMVFGWFIMLGLSRVNFRLLLDLSLSVYLFNLFLLVLVPVFGKTIYGAKRWIDIGPVNIQPSEFMKFSLLLFLSYFMVHTQRIWSKESLIVFLSVALPFVLTYEQPDLGTAVTYPVLLVFLLFLRGVKIRYFVISFLTFVLASPLLWHKLRDYQKERILALLDPYKDYMGSGYQLVQSMVAIGSGGLLGKGFLKGTQAHLLFLPEKHTDFIFSVIAEEWGFLGAFLLVSLYLYVIKRLLDYARSTPDIQEAIFIGGLASLLMFQAFVNLFMTMGLAPVVGVPIPMVSFGGSSIITFSLAFGCTFSIVREQKARFLRFEESAQKA
ncbi:rod shape-determining protein RodA [Thermocrinis minervae]|uniref:Rod shape determining protein RodA n=1 Tax=Thermocrinis minervae TaxID=381751 RepID=A0A1M6QW77_9AQUI|nr:rod shape-determining protein RodA [Thermocrinis minervae]SHK24519.1 rod shape determining protein RodA [Thermocrinis minervae]